MRDRLLDLDIEGHSKRVTDDDRIGQEQFEIGIQVVGTAHWLVRGELVYREDDQAGCGKDKSGNRR